ncbi:conserved hypothetical protein [Ricinus communis]|uniref:Uncharacterized protein n=1 Tax=Ricinus communis TaxID=3988 RepID=B9SQM7_RICCO|nr:conserved hypothetical protein [Ricinus communis]
MGAILRDNAGTTLHCIIQKFPPQFGYDQIEVETDSLQLVQMFHDEGHDVSGLHELIKGHPISFAGIPNIDMLVVQQRLLFIH